MSARTHHTPVPAPQEGAGPAASPPRARLGWGWLALAAGVHAGLAAGLLAAAPLRFWHYEELYNATVAAEVLAGHARWLPQLQYQPFCGGCTALSVAGAAVFAVAGPSFVAWKALPIGISVALGWSGTRLLERLSGRGAAVAFLLLWLAPPALLAQVMGMAWGNHFEVCLLVLLQVHAALDASEAADPRRALRRLGTWTGLGLWFCLSGAFAAPVLLAWLAPRLPAGTRGRAALQAGGTALLGVSPALFYALATGISPLAALQDYAPDHRALPVGETLAHKLAKVTLVSWTDSFQFTPGAPLPLLSLLTLIPLWTLGAAGLGRHGRKALLPALALAAVLVFLVSPFDVVFAFDRTHPTGVPDPIDNRYQAPTLVLALLLAGAGAGALWARPGAARWAALGLVSLATVTSLAARIAWFGEPAAPRDRPPLSTLSATRYPLFVLTLQRRLPEAALAAWDTRDPVSYVNSQRTLGVQRGWDVVRGSPMEALVLLAEWRRTSRRPEAVLHGLGMELARLSRERSVEPSWFLPQVRVVFQAATAAERSALAAALWAENPEVAGWPRLEESGCALCPAEGVARVRLVDPSQMRAPGDVYNGGEGALGADPARRAARLEGAGEAVGRVWGFRQAEVLDRVSAFPKADRDAFLRGYAIGRASRFRVPADASTPVEATP